MVTRRAAIRQLRSETKAKRLKQHIDTLTELVNTLVATLGQNSANVTPLLKRARRPELTLMLVEGALGIDVVTPRKEHTKIERSLPHHTGTKHTWDSVFNRLERIIADPNLDDEYDSDYERSASSRESPDLRAWLDARRA